MPKIPHDPPPPQIHIGRIDKSPYTPTIFSPHRTKLTCERPRPGSNQHHDCFDVSLVLRQRQVRRPRIRPRMLVFVHFEFLREQTSRYQLHPALRWRQDPSVRRSFNVSDCCPPWIITVWRSATGKNNIYHALEFFFFSPFSFCKPYTLRANR